MTENHDAQQVNREYDVGVKSSIGAILDLSRTVLLCGPGFARVPHYQGLMNPTPHKWEGHIMHPALQLVVSFQEDRRAAVCACFKENKPTAEK